MKGYRKVLIAVNGSREVLDRGLELAGDEKCWVTVVKVIPSNEGDLELVGVKNIGDVLESNKTKVMGEIKAVAAEEGALIKARLEEGDIPDKIVEVAEEEKCDLIIMGANKRNWFKRLFGKGIVEEVINNAPCPVLVVGA